MDKKEIIIASYKCVRKCVEDETYDETEHSLADVMADAQCLLNYIDLMEEKRGETGVYKVDYDLDENGIVSEERGATVLALDAHSAIEKVEKEWREEHGQEEALEDITFIFRSVTCLVEELDYM